MWKEAGGDTTCFRGEPWVSIFSLNRQWGFTCMQLQLHMIGHSKMGWELDMLMNMPSPLGTRLIKTNVISYLSDILSFINATKAAGGRVDLCLPGRDLPSQHLSGFEFGMTTACQARFLVLCSSLQELQSCWLLLRFQGWQQDIKLNAQAHPTPQLNSQENKVCQILFFPFLA